MIQNLITPKELARSLKINRATIYVWCQRGVIPHYDFGEPGKRGCIRFDLEEVKEWLKSRYKAAKKTQSLLL